MDLSRCQICGQPIGNSTGTCYNTGCSSRLHLVIDALRTRLAAIEAENRDLGNRLAERERDLAASPPVPAQEAEQAHERALSRVLDAARVLQHGSALDLPATRARLTESIDELDRLTPVAVPSPSPPPGVIAPPGDPRRLLVAYRAWLRGLAMAWRHLRDGTGPADKCRERLDALVEHEASLYGESPGAAPEPEAGGIARVREILAKPIKGSDMLDEIERVLDEEEGES